MIPEQSTDKSDVDGDMGKILMDRILKDGAPEGAFIVIHQDDRDPTTMVHLLQHTDKPSGIELKAGARWFSVLQVLSEGIQPAGLGVKHEQLCMRRLPMMLCNILQGDIKHSTSEIFF